MTTNDDPLPREQLRALQTRMLRHVIDHEPEEIDRRTVLIITKNDLLKTSPDFSLPEACLEAVERPESAFRLQGTHGPLLVLLLEESTRTSIDLITLLLNLDARFRQVALQEIDRQVQLCDPFISPDTKTKMGMLRPVITKQETGALSAAVELSDALKGDYFYNLAGCGQSARLELEDQLREFLHKVLLPTEAMVQFLLDLPIWSPSRQRAELITRVSQAAAAQSLSDFLDKYFRYFGHLPLAGEFSAGSAFTAWLEQHPWDASYPAKIWSWARQHGSPLATYHACQLLLGHKARLSGIEKKELIRRVAAMQGKQSFAKDWQYRCVLAAHYCRRLELLAPGADGERVAAMSWWLSENLSRLGDGFGKRARGVYEAEINAASISSHEVWRTCRPLVSASSLRYATLHLPSMWASSALCELAEAKLDGLLVQMPQEWETIAQVLAQPAARLNGLEPASGKAYAFERPMETFIAAVDRMAKRHRARGKKSKHLNDAMSDKSIEDRVRSLHNGGDVEAVAWALRAAAYSGNLAATPIWEAFSDPAWRRSVLAQGSSRAVELMTEAALELVARDKDHDWRSYLPHFLAVAAENEFSSSDGRKLLFDMIVLVSISVDSVSAIERLLRGIGRNQFAEAIKEWREKIERITPHAPAWIAARMRGTKSALYIA